MLGEFFLFAQSPPAAGIIFRRAPLEEMLRSRGVQKVFQNMQGKIVAEIRRALKEAELQEDGSPINLNDTREVNITRDFLRKPILQLEALSQLKEKREHWLQEIKNLYHSSDPLLSEDQINQELQSWREFFDQLQRFPPETSGEVYEDFVDRFMETEIGTTGEIRRRDLIASKLPLFKMLKEVWLSNIEKAFFANLPADQETWLQQSLENWRLFFDESEDWTLFVNYNIDIHPNFESLGFDYEFPEQGPLARGGVEVRSNLVVHVKNITAFIRNPSTGETISLGLPEVYGKNWNLSDQLRVNVGARVDLDLQRLAPDFDEESIASWLSLLKQEYNSILSSPESISLELLAWRNFLEEIGAVARQIDVNHSLDPNLDPNIDILSSKLNDFLNSQVPGSKPPKRRGDMLPQNFPLFRSEPQLWLSKLQEVFRMKLQPVSVELSPVQTNLQGNEENPGLLISEDAVETLIRDLITPERTQIVLSQFRGSRSDEEEEILSFEEMRSFGRLKTQLETDVVNFLRNQKMEFAVWFTRTSEDKLKTNVGVVNDELKIKLQKLRDEAQKDQKSAQRVTNTESLVGEFRTQIPLEIASAHMDYDPDTQSLIFNADLLEERKLDWEALYFEFPNFLFGDVEHPLVKNILSGLRDLNFANKNIQIETQIDFPKLENEEPGVQIRLPVTWTTSENSMLARPQIDIQNISVKVPGFENAQVRNIRFRAHDELDWVHIKPENPEQISDQVYTQLRPFMQNVFAITDPVGIPRMIERAMEEYLGLELGSMKMNLSDGGELATADKVELVDFRLPVEALKIQWDAEGEFNLDKEKKKNLKDAFLFLPEAYEAYRTQDSIHRIRTTLKIPQEIRLRIEGLDHAEAYIGVLEFSLRANAAQEIEIYWKFVRDSQGRLLMLPELLNIEKVLTAYSPVTTGSPQEGGPLIESVIPKNSVKRTIDIGSQVASVVGQAAGKAEAEGAFDYILKKGAQFIGWGAGHVQSYVEDTKQSSVLKELSKAMEEARLSVIPQVVETLVYKSNGHFLQNFKTDEVNFDQADLESIVSVRTNADSAKETAPLKALQDKFEAFIGTALSHFPAHRPFGQIQFNGESISDLTEGKMKEVIVETIDGRSPFSFWPSAFTNPGLSHIWERLVDTLRSRVAHLAQDNAEAIEERMNSVVQGEVRKEIENAMNKPFEDIRFDFEVNPSLYLNPNETASSRLELPEFICIGSSTSSPNEGLLPVWAWYENRGSNDVKNNYVENNPAPELDILISQLLQDAGNGAPDALLTMRLEDIQKRFIEPQLELARESVNQELARERPGTEILIGDVRIRVEKNEKGIEVPFVHAELRLKQTRGPIKFDSGAEYLQVKAPLQIMVSNYLHTRPEFIDSKTTSGYGLTVKAGYPVEIIDPNSGSIVNNLIKKEIAYPKLAAELTDFIKYEHIPKTIGLPLAQEAVQIQVQQPIFRIDANGEAHVFVGLNYNIAEDQGLELGKHTEIRLNPLEDLEDLNLYFRSQSHRNDFVLKQMFHDLLAASFLESRIFNNQQPLEIEVLTPSDGKDFVRPDQQNPDRLAFQARVNLRQKHPNAIQLPHPIEIYVPFEHFETQGSSKNFWLLDPSNVQILSFPEAHLINPATRDFLNFIKDADPRALRMPSFR